MKEKFLNKSLPCENIKQFKLTRNSYIFFNNCWHLDSIKKSGPLIAENNILMTPSAFNRIAMETEWPFFSNKAVKKSLHFTKLPINYTIWKKDILEQAEKVTGC